MTDTDTRRQTLDDLIKRRDDLKTSKGRIEGQLAEARKSLNSVEEECKQRKVAPDQLEGAITKLNTRYDSTVAALSTDIQGAEEALAPFAEETP